MIKSLKFSHKILLAASLVVFAAFALFTLYNDYLQRNAIREDLESYLREMGDVTSSNIQNWLGGRLLLVEQTAQVLEQQYTLRSEKTGDLSVEIFPLRYAVAEDRKIEYRDDEIEAPGIASILSRVLSDANVVAVGDEPGKLRPGPQSSHAVVQAEPSLNAVVGRDHKDRPRPSPSWASTGAPGFAWATTSRSRSAPPARIARRAAAPVTGRSAAWWTVAGWISCWPRSPCCRARGRRRSDPGRPC